MKITVLRNIGLIDLKSFGLLDSDNKPVRDDLTEGNVIDVEKPLAEKLIARKLATTDTKDVKAVPDAPEIKGVK